MSVNIKDAEKCASELHLTLTLQHPNPKATTEDGDEIGGKKLKRPLLPRHNRKLLVIHWEKRNGKGNWLKIDERIRPLIIAAATQELYQQMFPTKLYHQRQTGKRSGTLHVMCRMCGKLPENVSHVLAGCGTLPQTKYLARHNAALTFSSLSC